MSQIAPFIGYKEPQSKHIAKCSMQAMKAQVQHTELSKFAYSKSNCMYDTRAATQPVSA